MSGLEVKIIAETGIHWLSLSGYNLKDGGLNFMEKKFLYYLRRKIMENLLKAKKEQVNRKPDCRCTEKY
jgi:hypothetical protein